MVWGKSVLPKLQVNPTRVWDTFAEPNNLNNTECSFHTKSGLIPEFSGPSPKKQVNRGRLRMTAAQNLSYGVQKHLTKSGGLFFFQPPVDDDSIQVGTTKFAMNGIDVMPFL
jgi:hypothetical protein